MKSYWNLANLEWKPFGKRLWTQFWKDRVPGQSAQLGFYLVLSVFPFLLFITALLGLFLQSGTILEETLDTHLRAIAPSSVTTLLRDVLGEISKGSSGGKLTFGLLFALWAASHGMTAIMESLNIAYEVRESRVWWKRKLLGLALTLGFLLFTFLALLLLLYGPRLVDFLAGRFGLGSFATQFWNVLQALLLLAFVLIVFNSLYLLAPNVRHKHWHWLMPGTVVGVALWFAASYGFKVYLSYFNRYSATYGSIGAVIILLLWLYLTGIAILIGGEVNSELEKNFGDVEEKESQPESKKES